MRRLLTSTFFAALLVAHLLEISAQDIRIPNAASPAATVSQAIGISSINIKYSRPSVKGREIWGALVPYGWNVQSFGGLKEAPWRAGANENTVIELSHDATIEGKNVPAGSYGLFFVINKDNTGEVILSKDYHSWGSFWYDPANDLLRAPIKIIDSPMMERLTYSFENIQNNSAQLVLAWEKKQFPVSISFDVDKIVLANAREELKGPVGFGWQGYASAANYTLQTKKDIAAGMEWIDKAITQHKSFETLTIKSGLLQETGKTAEAEKAKADALAIATEVELNSYGYQLLGQQKMEDATAIFKLTTERFPKSPNAWDSLGEAYAIKGDSKNAIASFKKSLSMNPPDNVKANSEKYLRQLSGK